MGQHLVATTVWGVAVKGFQNGSRTVIAVFARHPSANVTKPKTVQAFWPRFDQSSFSNICKPGSWTLPSTYSGEWARM